jgi:CheY-like chemotaxis protein/predicted regulator of Ras-like GTPase activity (Roadblock/LC7/MglB family)
MADPRILLVDDQRQVTRMLRTSLELSGRSYDIVDVRSAEEALHEMERGPVDLVVTDLRLPEMTGLELIARIRQTHPSMRAILVTGQPTRQVEAQARALGVVAFIPKPVSTTLFLQAVDRALIEEQTGLPVPAIVGESARAAERLMTMQRELGAGLAILVTVEGAILLRAGDDDAEMIEPAVRDAAAALAAGLRASEHQGNDRPANFLYLDGNPYHLYITNVGLDRALIVGFAARQEPWQMGAIFHYARRIVDELGEILGSMKSVPASPVPATAEPAGASFEEPPTTPRAVQAFWDEAAASSSGQAPGKEGALSYEQARKLGLIPDDSAG